MAAADVLCPHCNSKQKVPEHRLTEAFYCLVCQQAIAEPWMHKVESEKPIELAIKLKGRLVSEFGTKKLEDIKSRADEYTGRFEPVDDEDEEPDDTGSRTRTQTRTDLPTSRGHTTLTFESGMYAAPPRRPGMSTAAKTYIVGGVLLAILATGVTALGISLLADDTQKTSEIHASGGEGERVELYPGGSVKAKWTVVLVSGLEQEHGPYQEFFPTGEQKILGSYHNGERIGTWTAWHENGQKASEISYKAGKEHGKWLEWHSNGQKAGEGEYVNGARHGTWRTWHRDGRMASSARHEEGKPLGEWVEWYPDGERKSHGMYKDGFKEGRWIYLRDNGSIELEELWSNGRLHGETFGAHRDRGKAFAGTWENGMRIGTWTWWHINGEVSRRGVFADGREDGVWCEWYPDGTLKVKGTYADGRRHGAWEEFDEDGEILSKREYSGDVLVNEQHFFRGEEVQQSVILKDGILFAEWTVLVGEDGEVKHGYEHQYHANGQKAESGAWLNGKKHGTWRSWNETGNLKNAQTWNNGTKVD